MECVLNELSLEKQFCSPEDFVQQGLVPLNEVLRDMRFLEAEVLYKKEDFYAAICCPGFTFYNLVFGSSFSRLNDKVRQIKSNLSILNNEPYWDRNPMQDLDAVYYRQNEDGSLVDVSLTSVAEAYARDAILVSFCNSSYESSLVHVLKGSADEKEIPNLWKGGQLLEVLFSNRIITIADYCTKRKWNKLDFVEIDKNNGFNLINQQNESEFLSGFLKFDFESWNDIHVDKGLDYKEFTKNKKTKDFFPDSLWAKSIHKFRITQEIRCFGYAENGCFHVLRFDLSHKLSDLG